MLSNPYLEGANKGVHNFPKSISPKVNVIAWLEIEHAYYGVTVEHVSYKAKWISPDILWAVIEYCIETIGLRWKAFIYGIDIQQCKRYF